MPVAEALIAYLDPLVASVAAGVSLFKGPMPELPDVCVAITHYGGESALDRTMGPSLQVPGAEVPHVQVMVRHTSNATAQSLATAIHALLDGYGPATLSGVTYHNIESLDGEPSTLGQDLNQRWRYVANYRVTKGRG